MIRRALLALAAGFVTLSAGMAAAQDATDPPPPVVVALPRVALETDLGRIVIEVDDQRSPITGGNFLRYVDEKRFDGVTFYRAMKTGGTFGIVQGGTNGDPRRVLPPIAHEPTTQTGLAHTSGAISMARWDPGTATGDFFISVGPQPGYDAGRSISVDEHGFAAFGKVVEGMDIVRQILVAPTSPTEGEGFMRGQMLDPEVTIRTARRIQAE